MSRFSVIKSAAQTKFTLWSGKKRLFLPVLTIEADGKRLNLNGAIFITSAEQSDIVTSIRISLLQQKVYSFMPQKVTFLNG
ncbi:TPA: hypothetical protein I7721_21005 [Vibrio vulnificus]|nr:hypothetical protein [Vibrio vulnificus]